MFKRNMMLVKGDICLGNDVTIPKGFLDPFIRPLPLIVNTRVREHKRC